MSKIEDALDKLSLCVAHHNNNEVSDEDLYKEIANVKAALSAIVPEGSVVVRREATEAMRNSAYMEMVECSEDGAVEPNPHDMGEIYAAMIKASEGT